MVDHRLLNYLYNNGGFSIYYDKLYKKEYLPTRIRYNQFFFFASLIGGCTLLFSKSNGGGMFCKMNGEDGELANRKYFTTERSFVNIVARAANSSSVSSHVAK